MSIWEAGVRAVRADTAMVRAVQWEGQELRIGDLTWHIEQTDELIVVGAGKGSAGMLKGLIQALIASGQVSPPRVRGWINVPEGASQLVPECPKTICIHEARPHGINEPTEAVVTGTDKILELVRSSKPNDLVIALISGGGSALLCSPIEGVTLEEKVQLTRALSTAGADIRQLNAVRRCLSRVKGGGLARVTSAHRLVTCVLSDVLGDPIEYIASGPTVFEPAPNPVEALQVLDQFVPSRFPSIRKLLQDQWKAQSMPKPMAEHPYLIIANNAAAVDAAGQKAVELGYRYWMNTAKQSEGDVLSLARQMAHQMKVTLSEDAPIDCIISGGEPTVTLPSNGPIGKGGRNQQLALGILCEFHRNGGWPTHQEVVFLSAGTDGEDGPTDAAGAMVDRCVYERMNQLLLDPEEYLARCDAYTFFEQTGGLIKTGPTHTNVCDLRVALFGSKSS